MGLFNYLWKPTTGITIDSWLKFTLVGMVLTNRSYIPYVTEEIPLLLSDILVQWLSMGGKKNPSFAS